MRNITFFYFLSFFIFFGSKEAGGRTYSKDPKPSSGYHPSCLSKTSAGKRSVAKTTVIRKKVSPKKKKTPAKKVSKPKTPRQQSQRTKVKKERNHISPPRIFGKKAQSTSYGYDRILN